MNFRLSSLLFIVLLVCFTACARKEKAMVELPVDEKVIEVKHDEVRLDDTESQAVMTTQPAAQTAPQKMSDNSEITVMYDGFGNKLEKRYFKGNLRLNSVLVRTAADGRREILVYGQNGERSTVDGALADRLMTASADEIVNAAKINGTRPSIWKQQTVTVKNEQTVPPTETLPPVTLPPPTVQPEEIKDETTIEEKAEEIRDNVDSTRKPPVEPRKEENK
jgi:hypothetical protein